MTTGSQKTSKRADIYRSFFFRILFFLLLEGKSFSCQLFSIEANISKLVLYGGTFGKRGFLTLLCSGVL